MIDGSNAASKITSMSMPEHCNRSSTHDSMMDQNPFSSMNRPEFQSLDQGLGVVLNPSLSISHGSYPRTIKSITPATKSLPPSASYMRVAPLRCWAPKCVRKVSKFIANHVQPSNSQVDVSQPLLDPLINYKKPSRLPRTHGLSSSSPNMDQDKLKLEEMRNTRCQLWQRKLKKHFRRLKSSGSELLKSITKGSGTDADKTGDSLILTTTSRLRSFVFVESVISPCMAPRFVVVASRL